MSISYINHNVSALNAARNLGANGTALGKSLERLSSGLRINRAADDAAGLAVSEKMRSQINGVNQAVRNAQDGISLIQTAEGGLNETHAILQRMRTLSVQASSDTYTDDDRTQAQLEVTELIGELDRIASDTEFNGQVLLDGTYTAKSIQVGAKAAQTITVGITAMDATTNLAVNAVDISTQAGASAGITTIDTAIGTVSDERATLGAVQNRLESTISNLSVTSENMAASESRIRDADIAHETTQFTRNQIMVQAATSILAQANMAPQNVLRLLG